MQRRGLARVPSGEAGATDHFSALFLFSNSVFSNKFGDIMLYVCQCDSKIQVIRSDNGKEYISHQFNYFCEEAGIEHQLTTPYTPQQNGVVERKSRTIMEMERCMKHEKYLPKKFWAEAANTTGFLLNSLPTMAKQGKTPSKAWYNHKHFVQKLKVFGCICFTYVPKVNKDKLDKKAEA
ncbi:unnamed protein product [Vicia faba]|uniref:Integrase catalytic domain-containing protein n=1 Tax=Vicia faba TaxID=3906 RepID=A0AAV1B7Q8_VICFA|nr:unnamed protein product [Vicia faba]